MIWKTKICASERKERRSQVSALISQLPQPTSSGLSAPARSTLFVFEIFQVHFEEHLEMTTKQPNQTQV